MSGVIAVLQLCILNAHENQNNGIWRMENDKLKISFDANHGGIVREFTYKDRGEQEVFYSEKSKIGGLSEDRLGGQPYPGEVCLSPYKAEYLEQSPERTVLKFSYQSESGVNKGLSFTKIYTLEQEASALKVDWCIENHSNKAHEIVPWVHNIVNGYGSNKGDTMLVLDGKIIRRKATGVDFMVTPGAGWIARIPQEDVGNGRLLFFMTDYSQTFQFYAVHFNDWHCLEMLFRRIKLDTGEKWHTVYHIGSAAFMENICAADETIALGINSLDRIQAGKENSIVVKLSAFKPLKEMPVTISVSDIDGKVIAEKKYEISVDSGKVSDCPLNWKPEKTGKYNIKVRIGKNSGNYFRQSGTPGEVNIGFEIGKEPFSGLKVADWPVSGMTFPEIKPRSLKKPLLARENGFYLWQENSLDRVFRKDSIDNFSVAPVDSRVNLKLAGGERESFQIVVTTAENPLSGCTFALPELKSSNGHVIAAENLSFRIVEYIKTTIPTSFKDYPIGEWPDPLLEKEFFDIPPGISQPVWFTLTVPRGTPAGQYDGVLYLKTENGRQTPVRLCVTVYPFEIPLKPVLKIDVGEYYGNAKDIFRQAGFNAAGVDINEMADELLLGLRLTPRSYVWRDIANKEKLENKLAGFEGIPSSTIFCAANPEMIKRLKPSLEKYGLEKYAWVYVADEIHSEHFPAFKKKIDELRKICDYKMFVTYYHGDAFREIYDYVDIWCRPIDDGILQRERMGKDEFWQVNSSLLALEAPVAEGRIQFMKLMPYGYKGVLLWSVINWFVNPWINPYYGSVNCCGCTVYPVVKGLASSIRLEAIADAVEDFDYLAILKERLTADGSKLPEEQRRRAEQILSNKHFYDKIKDSGDLLKLKSEIAGLINAMN
jgi:hypothetical protein